MTNNISQESSAVGISELAVVGYCSGLEQASVSFLSGTSEYRRFHVPEVNHTCPDLCHTEFLTFLGFTEIKHRCTSKHLSEIRSRPFYIHVLAITRIFSQDVETLQLW